MTTDEPFGSPVITLAMRRFHFYHHYRLSSKSLSSSVTVGVIKISAMKTYFFRSHVGGVMDDRVIVSETRLEEGNGNVAFDNVFFLRSTPFSFSPERQKHLEKKLDVRYPLSLPRKMQVLRFPAIYIPYRILICPPPPPALYAR